LTTATKDPELAVKVGPSPPAKTKDDEVEWRDSRTMVVKLAARLGVRPDREVLDDSLPAEDAKLWVGPGREEVAKGETLSAPSTVVSEGLSFGRQDFVDEILEPPFPFESLCRLLENSGALRQNIDAMRTNVDGFGHRFTPVLDFSAPTVNDDIRDLMVRQKLEGTDDLLTVTAEELEKITPGVDEVEETRKLWDQLARVEHGRLESFFDFLSPGKTFIQVRKLTRLDLELLGNAGWEVIRERPDDPESRIQQVVHVPFVGVRLVKADDEPTAVKVKVRRDPIHYEDVTVHHRFRRFVRILGNGRTYYKEFGDPRVVSRVTGRFFEDVDALKKEEGPESLPANEFYHWKVESPVSVYGVPRWIGALIAVLGSRAAEEVNLLYFDNKAMPPMVLMVSGGRVSEDSVSRLETYIEDRIKGRENFHKIMVLEAVPSDADVSEGDLEYSGKLRIELKPLTQDQAKDGLFQEYDEANVRKIGRAFRQSPIMTGDTRDQNRATAMTAKALAEEQVYQPERDDFDAVMDRIFLPSLIIHFWRFKTNAPVQRIPNDLVDNATKSLREGAMTPNEARELLSDAFSVDLPHRVEDWGDIPPRLALAAARQGALPSAEPTQQPEPGEGEGQEPGEEPTGSAGETGEKTSPRKATSAAHKLAGLMALLRAAVREEIEVQKDDFFDPSAWDADEEVPTKP